MLPHPSPQSLLDASHSEASLSACGVKRGHVAILLSSLPHAEPLEAVAIEIELPVFDFGPTRPSRFGPSALKFPADFALPLFTFDSGETDTAGKTGGTAGEDDEEFDFSAKKEKKKKKKAKEEEGGGGDAAEEAEFDFGEVKKKKKKPKEGAEGAEGGDGEAEFDFGDVKKKVLTNTTIEP